MNRRSMWMALGCLALSLAVVSPAEAGGRSPRPTGTRVTITNKSAKQLLVAVYAPPPYLLNVGDAKKVGAKVINPGATAVFSNLKTVDLELEAYDTAMFTKPVTDAQTLVFPGAPGDQLLSDSIDAVKNKNTAAEIRLGEEGYLVLIEK